MATWFKGRRKDGAEQAQEHHFAGQEPPTVEHPVQDYAGQDYAGTDYPGADYPGADYTGQQFAGQPDYQQPEYQQPEYQQPHPDFPAVYSDPPPQPGVAPIDPQAHEQLLAERKAMVSLCLYAHDRARSSGVAERLEEGLAGVGVQALRPDGERFDPTVHEAGGTVETADPALDGLVAETEVVGFSDRGTVLRPPIVTVYKAPGS